MTTSTIENSGVSRLEAAEELLARRKGRANLIPFCKYTKRDYIQANHLNILASYLEEIERGELTRLIVTMPPRHGKSEHISVRLPVWYLGRNPERRIVVSSYAESLAIYHSRQARDIIVSPEFRILFPHVVHRPETSGQQKIPEVMQRAQEWGTVQGGSYYAVGVGGGLSGRGYELGIIDDPTKDFEESVSIAYQERLWNWYQTVFRTRANPGAAIIAMMTRWGTSDLVGRLIDLANSDPLSDQWLILHFKAISEEGDKYEYHTKHYK